MVALKLDRCSLCVSHDFHTIKCMCPSDRMYVWCVYEIQKTFLSHYYIKHWSSIYCELISLVPAYRSVISIRLTKKNYTNNRNTHKSGSKLNATLKNFITQCACVCVCVCVRSRAFRVGRLSDRDYPTCLTCNEQNKPELHNSTMSNEFQPK